ncbi:hypothetical protein GQ464_012860 [Rhodocaloribacter litoris]|nr:hypothetical protein [Rhodocaloribacter litoris]QXD14325.1 hypothetical protein GQ464_012860 [Rhodocaloribacter litoris]
MSWFLLVMTFWVLFLLVCWVLLDRHLEPPAREYRRRMRSRGAHEQSLS